MYEDEFVEWAFNRDGQDMPDDERAKLQEIKHVFQYRLSRYLKENNMQLTEDNFPEVFNDVLAITIDKLLIQRDIAEGMPKDP